MQFKRLRMNHLVRLLFCLLTLCCSVQKSSSQLVSPVRIPRLAKITDGVNITDLKENPPQTEILAFSDWLTVAGAFDFFYRETQFYLSQHQSYYGQWEVRIEFWGPPFRRTFSWGAYLRLAGIKSSSHEAFEDAWLAVPGYGLQIYPLSFAPLSEPNNVIGLITGPLRIFAERNHLHYWGAENAWRPETQDRMGADYYRGFNVNSTTRWWWSEIYWELVWKSTNEFDLNYNGTIFGSALRLGGRIPRHAGLSLGTFYLIMENIYSEKDYAWENKLLSGIGMRFAPDLRSLPHALSILQRLLVYVEYLHVVQYYKDSPVSGTPNYDFRIGISTALGDFWK